MRRGRKGKSRIGLPAASRTGPPLWMSLGTGYRTGVVILWRLSASFCLHVEHGYGRHGDGRVGKCSSEEGAIVHERSCRERGNEHIDIGARPP